LAERGERGTLQVPASGTFSLGHIPQPIHRTMQTSTRSLLLAAATAFSAAAVSGQVSTAPCFEPNLGTNLGLWDDSVAQGNVLGFSFPGPGGVPVTSIDISSNGFVWLGSSTDNGCCGGYLQGFLTDLPRIAPYWSDLNPSVGGAVYFNAFPATPTSLARAVVTWDQVPEYGTTQPMTIQLQMFADGSMVFMYDGNVGNQYHNVLVGVTEGVAAVANPVDFSSISVGSPYISATNATLHEEQGSGFDLTGKSFEFTPVGTGYLVVDRPACTFGRSSVYGFGCPKPAVAYEYFDFANPIDLSNSAIDFVALPGGGYLALPATGFFTGYTNAISSGDDVVTGPFTLPFAYNFPGGNTTGIDISSNGFVWLSTGNFNPRCCYGDPYAFVADGPSIAGLWQDLNPSAGGTIYYDVDPNNTEVHITWVGVPEFPAVGANTFQITLRSDGSFRLSYQGVANQSHDALVGFSQGFGVTDPGTRDFSQLPFSIGSGGTALELAAAVGSRPVLGQNFTMDINQISNGTVLGAMILGFGSFNPGIDLSPLGLTGCDQYVSLDASNFFPTFGNPSASYVFGVPSSTAFAGFLLYAQAATVTPGINPTGVVVSNGLAMEFGF
jgi:hypothetical protein